MVADNFDIFDFIEGGEKWKPIKSNDWKWTMADDYPKEKNGLKVFSCFACGGGSTMGYKLAGCDVLGCVEIDPKMNEIYVKNHNPRFNYCMDIRDFNKIPNEELPPELFNLDILDGSPPCTTFSMAGDREESWGKKKKFKEGQAEQTLDDLSFVFVETVAKLKPKCVIMENVEGLIKGEAWAYVQRIYKEFGEIGYEVGHWLLKGENMGVPQKRHRVIFIAARNDTDFDIERLDMVFNYQPIVYGEIKEGTGEKVTDYQAERLAQARKGDENLGDINLRLHGKQTCFTDKIVWDDDILQTITANGKIFRGNEKNKISNADVISATTFPRDYQFIDNSHRNVRYICGMSVPPVMIKRVVTRLIESGVFDVTKSHE